MYARNAYLKQRQENLMPGVSPATSDEDGRRKMGHMGHVGHVGGGGGPTSSLDIIGTEQGMLRNDNRFIVGTNGGRSVTGSGSIMGGNTTGGAGDCGGSGGSGGGNSNSVNALNSSIAVNSTCAGVLRPVFAATNSNTMHSMANNHTSRGPKFHTRSIQGDSNWVNPFISNGFAFRNNLSSGALHPGFMHYDDPNHLNISLQKRRTRTILVGSALAFVGMLVLDGFAQFNVFSDNMETMGTVEKKSLNDFGKMGNLMESGNYYPTGEEPPFVEPEGFVRRLVGSLHPTTPNRNTKSIRVPDSNEKRRVLHTFPLIPKHALQSRHRRELIRDKKPLPPYLVEGAEDEMYHAPAHQRRRMYPMASLDSSERGEVRVVDARLTHRRIQTDAEVENEEELDEATLYETGALYQGYGTHYLDLWVGTPPQRQTVIVDTGSSVTAFPCTGCLYCGSDPATGTQYHVDPDFEKEKSSTFEQATCRRAESGVSAIPCPFGMCVNENLYVADSPQVCKLTVSYAEGSSWTAVEVSDKVYPAGPHNESLETSEEMEDHGVGVGMGDISDEKPFEWLDFRLMFGCQTRVTGLFRTQLEAGIMGMDNREGAFWLQLSNHYRKNGHEKEAGDTFDPNQFSLCYDRQPLSIDLSPGVGSGQFTLGGSDPLLHLSPMVFADNITPKLGWYTVRIKGMFLRSHGGDLANPHLNADAIRYARVDADENYLNNDSRQGSGVIVDSGTTDTYLSQLLKPAFDKAWKEALQNPGAKYNNDKIEMTPDQVKKLPTVLIVLKGHNPSFAKGLQPDAASAAGMAGNSAHSEMFKPRAGDETTNSISKNDIVIAIPPEHYMDESHRYPGVYTARIYFSERFGAQAILGSNFIMGHEVLFDNVMGRVGFAESHCDYARYKAEKDYLLMEALGTEEVVEDGTAGNKPVEDGTAGSKPVEDRRTAGNKPVEDRTAGNKPVENGAEGKKPVENGTAGNKPGESEHSKPKDALHASGWARTLEGHQVVSREIKVPG